MTTSCDQTVGPLPPVARAAAAPKPLPLILTNRTGATHHDQVSVFWDWIFAGFLCCSVITRFRAMPMRDTALRFRALGPMLVRLTVQGFDLRHRCQRNSERQRFRQVHGEVQPDYHHQRVLGGTCKRRFQIRDVGLHPACVPQQVSQNVHLVTKRAQHIAPSASQISGTHVLPPTEICALRESCISLPVRSLAHVPARTRHCYAMCRV